MRQQVRVWSLAAVTALALLGLEVGLAAAVRAQCRQVLAPGPASVDEVVGALAAILGLVLGAWLAGSSTAAVLAHAPGRPGALAGRLAEVWAPLLTRRAAAAIVGATVAGGLGPATALAHETTSLPGFSASTQAGTDRAVAAVEAVAAGGAVEGAAFSKLPAPGWSVPHSVPHSVPEQAVAGKAEPPADTDLPPAGWTPSRPVQRPIASPELVTSGTTPTDRIEVVVHRGDTLWDLVAARLGPDVTDADIAQAWPRWHAVNRAVIGDDPDRLLPGQVLQVPTSVPR